MVFSQPEIGIDGCRSVVVGGAGPNLFVFSVDHGGVAALTDLKGLQAGGRARAAEQTGISTRKRIERDRRETREDCENRGPDAKG